MIVHVRYSQIASYSKCPHSLYFNIQQMASRGMIAEIFECPHHFEWYDLSVNRISNIQFYDPSYTPTSRGFDTFLGYYGDKEDYYLKNISEWTLVDSGNISLQEIGGFDFRNGTEAVVIEEYSTYLYGNETLRIMEEHVKNVVTDGVDADPFFIMLSSQAAHVPYAAPQEALDQFTDIEDDDRAELAAVISVFDQSLGDIVEYLRSEQSGHLWDEKLLIFTSDNGGALDSGASNFPLRFGLYSVHFNLSIYIQYNYFNLSISTESVHDNI